MKEVLVCPNCEGENVTMEACAKWGPWEKVWKLRFVVGHTGFCVDCFAEGFEPERKEVEE